MEFLDTLPTPVSFISELSVAILQLSLVTTDLTLFLNGFTSPSWLLVLLVWHGGVIVSLGSVDVWSGEVG